MFATSGKEPRDKEDGKDDEEELDEFGRRRPPPAPPAPRWPPPFETHGSSYVLDNRSGMFYEAKSNFFYDPTTKLYYSHEKQAYFRHRILEENGKSVFDKVDDRTPTQVAESAATPTASTDKQMILPAISINLKTKSLGKKPKKKKDEHEPNKSTGNNAPPGASIPARKSKEHEADLAKWSERQIERKAGGRDISKIPKTAKGEPICSLCQRKFPTLDKLLFHERVSELHKSYLAKKAAAAKKVEGASSATTTAATQDNKSTTYTDRAEQRRLMHGPENPGPVSLTTNNSEEAVAPIATAVDPKETLNETNIGNKMLQKLGWQQGKGLGRREASRSSELQQDWDRIERLAASNGSRK